MKRITTILFLSLTFLTEAQTIIDRRHLQIVNENAIARNSAELGYQANLEKIRENTADISLNTAAMALAKTKSFRSLSQVDDLMKNSYQLKQIIHSASVIYDQSSEMLEIAGTDPALVAFAEVYAREAAEKTAALVMQLSSFVLKEGNNILISHNVRDELLSNTLESLTAIRGRLLSIHHAMYWTKVNGTLKKLNPYQKYVEKDVAMMDEILRKKRILDK